MTDRSILPKTASPRYSKRNSSLEERRADGFSSRESDLVFMARRYFSIFFTLYKFQFLAALVAMLLMGVVFGLLAGALSFATTLIVLLEFRRGDHVSIDDGLLRQVSPVLVACGLLLLLAGFLLETISNQTLFRNLPSLINIVPVLLGLKCNLEMTLASRLGSAYHLGHLAEKGTSTNGRKIFLSNTGIVVIQSFAVGCVAPVILLLTELILSGATAHQSIGNVSDALLVFATSVVSATSCCAITSQFTIFMTKYSIERQIDPDNGIGAIASSFGDCIAILIYMIVSHIFERSFLLSLLGLSVVTASLPFWWNLANRHPPSAVVLKDGWMPLGVATLFGLLSGALLRNEVADVITLFVPVLNGIGGNIVGIFSSKLSSDLHMGGSTNKRSILTTTKSLFALVAPLQFSFVLMVYVWNLVLRNNFSIPPMFFVYYIMLALVQTYALMALSKFLGKYAVTHGLDPDNHILPYTTSIADFLGSFLLVVVASSLLS